jgi:hypothetical protein
MMICLMLVLYCFTVMLLLVFSVLIECVSKLDECMGFRC